MCENQDTIYCKKYYYFMYHWHNENVSKIGSLIGDPYIKSGYRRLTQCKGKGKFSERASKETYMSQPWAFMERRNPRTLRI